MTTKRVYEKPAIRVVAVKTAQILCASDPRVEVKSGTFQEEEWD